MVTNTTTDTHSELPNRFSCSWLCSIGGTHSRISCYHDFWSFLFHYWGGGTAIDDVPVILSIFSYLNWIIWKKSQTPKNFRKKRWLKKTSFFCVFFMFSKKSCSSNIAWGIFSDFTKKVPKKTCRLTVERLWEKWPKR